MERRKILVVDDDTSMLGAIVEVLRRGGYEVEACANGLDGLESFQARNFDMVISDIKMPRMTGLELLERIKQIDPEVPFVVITAFGDVKTAVEAMKKGAYDYLEKDAAKLLGELEMTVERTMRYGFLLRENRQLKQALQKRWTYIGTTVAMEEIRELAKTVAESRSTVLVSGESGTGKELIARSIHYLSPRQEGPFVKINCAALPEGLIESELFGHEKGSFTGAVRSKTGKFELASGGTLLLDEIGEMPSAVQAKLLRVLQEREITKVGGDIPIPVDVRIVATTNRELEKEVEEGRFREDLYYRLNVFHINLPPLRERMDDLEQLAEHFVKKYNEDNGFSVEGFDPACREVLRKHSWPGNIRELENAVERAVVLTRTGQIGPECFKFRSPSDSKGDAVRVGMTVADAERELIIRTLEFSGQNRTKAAQMLGISIRTLRNKLNEYGAAKDE